MGSENFSANFPVKVDFPVSLSPEKTTLRGMWRGMLEGYGEFVSG